MWKLGRTLVILGYLMPMLWVGWILTQPGDGSLGSGILFMVQLLAVASASLLSLVCGTVTATIGWRRSANVRPVVGYFIVAVGMLGTVALAGALLWLM